MRDRDANLNSDPDTLAEYERRPEFRKRAKAVERGVRAAVLVGRAIDLGDVADALQVPLDIAAIWLVGLALEMGDDKVSLTVTGQPS